MYFLYRLYTLVLISLAVINRSRISKLCIAMLFVTFWCILLGSNLEASIPSPSSANQWRHAILGRPWTYLVWGHSPSLHSHHPLLSSPHPFSISSESEIFVEMFSINISDWSTLGLAHFWLNKVAFTSEVLGADVKRMCSFSALQTCSHDMSGFFWPTLY